MTYSSLSAFKAYDIRGRVPLELNPELVRQIGLAYAAEFSPKTVCVGYDMRLTSRDFALILMAALQDGGVDVIDLGLSGTEEVYYATFSQGFDGGIMITASHNPKDWNGLKLVGKDARPINGDNGLKAISDRIIAGDLPIAEKRGAGTRQNVKDEYVQHLLSCLGQTHLENLAPLTIVANAGNGCAWPIIEKLAERLPCKIIPLYQKPDGTFPNGVPNPLLPENRSQTSSAVIEHNADLGLAWDGDFDRCFFFDEKGNFIEGYYLVALLAKALLKENPGAKILHDSRLTWNTIEVVTGHGGIPIEHKTGHAFMKDRMRKEDALYGGEMSAHYYFKSFAYCDSGMLVWLLLYKLLSEAKLPLSQMVKSMQDAYPASGEINRSLTDPDAAIARIEAQFAENACSVTYIDGVSIEYPEWRCNIRKSNTEPLLRLNVETRGNPSLLKEKTEELLSFMY